MTNGGSLEGNRYYLHYDQVGSLRAVSDTNHNIIKEITYDTYGNIINNTNPSFKIPFGFAGGLYDPDTRLTHFGFREYDAYTGKWTSKDPIGFAGGDSNLYGYVLGDPVNLVDPTGENPFLFFLFFVGLTEYLNSPSVGENPAQGVPPTSLLLPLPALAQAEGLLCKTARSEGLGNPFKNKTAEQIDKMFRKKGFEPRGRDPLNGYGGYVNPNTGRSYHIDPIKYGKYREPNHIDVNRPKGLGLPKKKYPFR